MQSIPNDQGRIAYLQKLLSDTERNIANFRDATPSVASEYTDSGAESDRSDDVSYVSWKRDVLPPQYQREYQAAAFQRSQQQQRTPQQVSALSQGASGQQRTPQQAQRTPQQPTPAQYLEQLQALAQQQKQLQAQRTPQQPGIAQQIAPTQYLEQLQVLAQQQQQHEQLRKQLEEQRQKHDQLQAELQRRQLAQQQQLQQQQKQQKWNHQLHDLQGFSQELTSLQSQLQNLLHSPALSQLKAPRQPQQVPAQPQTPPRKQTPKRGSYPSPSSSRGLPNTSCILYIIQVRPIVVDLPRY